MDANQEKYSDADISRFIEGQMTPAERNEFLEKCRRDAALKGEVVFRQKLKFALKHQTEFALLQDLRQQPDVPEQPHLPTGNKLRWAIVGAAALALVAVVWWGGAGQWFRARAVNQKITQRIENQYSGKSYPLIFAGIDTTSTDPLTLACKAYSHNQFGTAAKHFGEEFQKSKNMGARLFEGIAQYLDGQPDTAVAALENVAEARAGDGLGEVANWHLALCFLKMGKIEEARRLLDGLKNSPEFGTDAVRLFDDLRQLEI